VNNINIIDLDIATMENNLPQLINMINDWPLVNWGKKNFMCELPGKWNYSFAITNGKRIDGFCIASEKITGFIYIHLLFVANIARGKGMGKLLINEALRRCNEYRLNGVVLRCPISNKDAVGFYQQLGFVISQILCDDISGETPDYLLKLNLN
jgi:ribosomal protein S18 acetylase RimI-like enzyme